MSNKKKRRAPRTWGKVEPRGKRYRASYPHPFGKKDAKGNVVRIFAPDTFATRDAADLWLSQQRTAIDDGWTPKAVLVQHETHAAKSETVGENGFRYIDRRLTTKGEPLTARTKDTYRSNLKAFGPEILNMPLGELEQNPQVIERFYLARIGEGKKTSTSDSITLLQQILTKAVADGIIDHNPCRDRRTGEPLIRGAANVRTEKKADMVLITAAQLTTIEEFLLNEYDWQFSMMVTVAAWSSVRFGELTELRRLDCWDDGEIITLKVHRSVTHSSQGCVIRSGTKTGNKGIRSVELPPEASAGLRQYLNERVPDDANALLFPAKEACHYRESTMTDWWYVARKTAGCPTMTFHDLRHFGLTEYARIAGVTLQDIMYRGGHMRIETAMRYQHAANDQLRKEQVRQMGLRKI